MCLCNCMCMLLLCVCIRFGALCVSFCSSSSALHSGLPLSRVKAEFPMSRDGERYLGCTGVRWGFGSEMRVV